LHTLFDYDDNHFSAAYIVPCAFSWPSDIDVPLER
jgi:hypothetical protein